MSDYKEVLRRFIDDAEAGKLRRTKMPFAGSILSGIITILMAVAIGVAVGSIWHAVMG